MGSQKMIPYIEDIEDVEWEDIENDEPADNRGDYRKELLGVAKIFGLFILGFLFIELVQGLVAEDLRVREAKKAMSASVIPIPTLASPVVENRYPSLHWMDPEEAEALAESSFGEEILCFAQILQSETNDEGEMTLIGWVVNNRLYDPKQRWGDTYCSVAYSPHQFSGLNSTQERFEYNTSLSFEADLDWKKGQDVWELAIQKALALYSADMVVSPLHRDARFFYSPKGMKGQNSYPEWAKECKAIVLKRDSEDQNKGKVTLAIYRESTCPSLSK